MKKDLFYQIALTMVPQIGPVQARILLEKYGDAQTIFTGSKLLIEKTEGIGSFRARYIRDFRDFGKVEKELAFIERYQIKPLFLTDPDYPRRLLNCYDPPTMLYYKGNADLNALKVVAVIGTRLNTHYGKSSTEKLMAELEASGALIVSGLAFGIDAIAHKSALKHGLATAGVLAHGLDTLYPPEHNNMAKEMINQGGLLTEFISQTKPDKHNFPQRNRIVAGMSDATIVIETGAKGGSMITAELANGYNRDVFAFPGRVTDAKSAGCNHLIRNNKAILLNDIQQFMSVMGWETPIPDAGLKQRALFHHLSDQEKTIMEIIKHQEFTHIDELSARSNLPLSIIASALLNLELQRLIKSLPGKMYEVIG